MRTLLAALALLLLAIPARAESEDEKPAVHVYDCLGEPSRFVIRGRALSRSGEQGSSALKRNLQRLVKSRAMEHAKIVVRVEGETRTVESDDDGLYAAEFDLGKQALARGEHKVEAAAGRHLIGEGVLHVVLPDDLIVVSDFDDTIAITGVVSKKRLLTSAFLLDESTQPRVPGMPELYQCLREGKARATFVYLSGSPVEYYGRVRSFLARNGFPPGALMLRKLDASSVDALGYKKPKLLVMLRELPTERFLFFGDSGEKDPEVYSDVSALAGTRLLGTFIRLVTPEAPVSARFAGEQVFQAPDTVAASLLARGMITAECAAKVKGALLPVPADAVVPATP